MTSALLTLGVGMLAWIAPDVAATIFIYMLAAWAFILGLMEFTAAGILRGLGPAEGLARGLGIISIAFSLLMFIRPGISVVAVALLIGLYLIATGIMMIHHAFLARAWDQASTQTPPI